MSRDSTKMRLTVPEGFEKLIVVDMVASTSRKLSNRSFIVWPHQINEQMAQKIDTYMSIS